MDIHKLTIVQTRQGLINKKFSAVEIAKVFIEKIKKNNPDIFAYLTETPDFAISQAKEVDKLISQKKDIPLLAGIPSAIKDNILVEDIKCTAASKILNDYIAPYDATVIKKLKSQKAVILGKTNLDEFAMGSSCEHSAYGPTRNPHDLSRVPGGSSGGSAAAVASDMAVYALGSDTGGSIRFPASLCGVVGLKPTYGSVSRYGLMAMASSLDQIGSLTKTVEDAKIVFNAIKGKDPLDSTSVEQKSGEDAECDIKKIKLGVPKEYFIKGMDKGVEKKILRAIDKFKALGAKIEEISLPHTEYALAVYYIIMPAEVSSNLARYDGIRYGFSETESESLLDTYLHSRNKGFGDEVRRRIIIGTYSLSAGYYDAYYLRAQKAQTLIRKDFSEAFKKVDAILSPVSPVTAFKIGEKITDPLTMYLFDVFTVAVNLAGLPAISIPCGKVNNLPVGLQIIGPAFKENRILSLGQLFEQNQ